MIFDNISKKMQWRKCNLFGKMQSFGKKKKKGNWNNWPFTCQKKKRNQKQTSQKLKPVMDHRPECKMQNYKSPRR